MKLKFLLLITILLINTTYSQTKEEKEEISETIEWLNEKINTFQLCNEIVCTEYEFGVNFELVKDKPILIIEQKIKEKNKAIKLVIAIPLVVISKPFFVETDDSEQLFIYIKNQQKAITYGFQNGKTENSNRFAFYLDKNITNTDLKERIIKAFEYIIKITQSNSNEKF